MGRSRSFVALVACAALALFALGISALGASVAQTGPWEIRRFQVEMRVDPDASVRVTELIEVRFHAERHGIYREIPVKYDYDETHYRVYRIDDVQVVDGAGRPWPVKREIVEANVRLRIGDPDRYVSGAQTYVIRYTLRGALNAFESHDELYWNVSGAEWEVPRAQVSAVVRLPGARVQRAACFEGPRGSTAPCRQAIGETTAAFVATRMLFPNEDLTIVAALPKGVVAAPPVLLEEKPRTIDRYFETTPFALGSAGTILVGGLGAIGWNWWARGRDRRYLKRAASVEEGAERTAPLFDAPTVVTEYEPPEKLLPAQIGLLLDESADTKDLTATLVDLAVRGHLRITEIPPSGLFGRRDWKLERLESAEPLADFEDALLSGVVGMGGAEILLSAAKGTVADDLKKAQRALYDDSLRRGWFTGDPGRARLVWAGIGFGLTLVGIGLVFGLGATFGLGIVALAVVALGLVLLVTHRAMARRTATGSELFRRALGFGRYLETAEKHRADFAERAGIFSTYLPYAIVYGCVERWAKAFEGLDRAAAAAATGWYVGQTPFSAAAFSSDLQDFSSHVTSTIGSTPASSGSSGFSSGGGFSGGGGGGGGGGSW